MLPNFLVMVKEAKSFDGCVLLFYNILRSKVLKIFVFGMSLFILFQMD